LRGTLHPNIQVAALGPAERSVTCEGLPVPTKLLPDRIWLSGLLSGLCSRFRRWLGVKICKLRTADFGRAMKGKTGACWRVSWTACGEHPAEPELPDYPKDPGFLAKFGPRGVLDCKASGTDDSTVDPRFGKVGKHALWCADYKGEVMLGNRRYCYP
jgi:hypothetical protein